MPNDEKAGGLYVARVCVVAALGGLLFGYDTGVINGAIGPLKAYFMLDAIWEGLALGCALLGCALGAATAGTLSDWFGRKKVLMIASIMFLVSAIGTALPWTITTFIIFRIIGGVGVGAAAISSPMYIAEISPARIRGRMVSVNQFAIVTGFLVVYFVNYFIVLQGDLTWNEQFGWRWMFGSEALPATLLLVLLLSVPESPRWLVKQGRSEEALRILTLVESPTYAQAEMVQIADMIGTVRKIRISRVLFSFSGRIGRVTFIGIWMSLIVININIFVMTFFMTFFVSPVVNNVILVLLWLLWSCIAFWIMLAIQAKRWHDRDKSAWMILINLIPIVGLVWIVVELGFLRGTHGSNQYGEDPNEGGRELLIGIVLAVLQQVTGINVFLYFGTEIFKEMGSETNAALLQTVIVGMVNLSFTIIAIWMVDRLGRKPLMMIGSVGMGISLLAMGLAAYCQRTEIWILLFILSYIACFALSVGPVTWVILSEIFPTRIRGQAMAIATVFLWLANYVVSQTFPMMDENPWLIEKFHRGFPFWIYGVFCVCLLVFVWRFVPETKGKTLEEIEKHWMRQ